MITKDVEDGNKKEKEGEEVARKRKHGRGRNIDIKGKINRRKISKGRKKRRKSVYDRQVKRD